VNANLGTNSYVQDLSPKKQDKALINARRAANIRHVLIDKKTTSIESAQFRYGMPTTSSGRRRG
jgi:hypothetical protein